MNRPAGEQSTTGRRHPLKVVALVALGAVLTAGAVVGFRSLHWPIETVRIEGETRFTDRAALEAVVARHTRHGFFGTDLADLRRDIRELPWVRDAGLRRVWPDRVDVDIREHRAVARWHDDGLLSARGTVFRPETFDRPELPRLAGPETQAAAMLRRLRRYEVRLAPIADAIAGMEQDARRSWTLRLADGPLLRLGRERLDERLARVVAAWPQVVAGRHDRIRAIDLRYPNGFAVAWRESAAESPEGGA